MSTDFTDYEKIKERHTEQAAKGNGARKPHDDRTGKERAAGHVHIVNGATVMPEPIDWIWQGYLARRKLHVLAGSKGDGKTTIAVSLAAAYTSGGILPDGNRAPLGDVLMWSGEDNLPDSLLPRLIMCGGDPARFHYIGGIEESSGKERPFDPSCDIPALIETVRALPALVFIIIDPIVAAVAGDSHKNAETRRGLQPLVDLASELDAAVLGLTHFTKNTTGRDPIDRITGSLAFGALPRVLWGTAKPLDANRPRRLVRVASNIGPDGGGFEYDLVRDLLPNFDFQAQFVRWGMQLDGPARTLLSEVEAEDRGEGSRTAKMDKPATGYTPRWRRARWKSASWRRTPGLSAWLGAPSTGRKALTV